MRKAVFGLAVLLFVLGCVPAEPGQPQGAVYRRAARPAVWRVLPRTQAESLGIQPGDVFVSYNNRVVETNDELARAIAEAAESPGRVGVILLRGDEEVSLEAWPGPLGVVPDAGRYTASLALAVEDILAYFGVDADYDWLGAVTAENFAFTANREECPAWWPNALAGEYLDGLEDLYGLQFRTLYAYGYGDSAVVADSSQTELVRLIRRELGRDRVVLIRGGWPDEVDGFWGVVTRYEDDDSLLYGFTLGLADEQPVPGEILEAYEVRLASRTEPDPEELLRTVLVQALEMGQAYSDSGWQSGLVAYDVWIGALDSVPFCPECGEASQDCFDRLAMSLLSAKESANRFLADMSDALPDESDIIAEAMTANAAIISKLNGIGLSGVRVGTRESQQKLARVVADIQLLESQLLMIYEELLGEL